jgi:hypothetical protein
MMNSISKKNEEGFAVDQSSSCMPFWLKKFHCPKYMTMNPNYHPEGKSQCYCTALLGSKIPYMLAERGACGKELADILC